MLPVSPDRDLYFSDELVTFVDLFQQFSAAHSEMTASQVFRCRQLCRIVDEYFEHVELATLTQSDISSLLAALQYIRVLEISAANFCGEQLRHRTAASEDAISYVTWIHHLRALHTILRHAADLGQSEVTELMIPIRQILTVNT